MCKQLKVIEYFIENNFTSKDDCPYKWNYIAEQVGYNSGEMARSEYRRNKHLLQKPLLITESYKKEAKILLFDIETSPSLAYVWGIWQQDISPEFLINDWFMLSWSAKWLYEKEIMSDVLTSEEVLNQDDKRICESIWKLLNEADIVIAHNGDKFDVKKLNARFLIHNIILPTPYITIDTLKHAKKTFALTRNTLDSIAELLGLDGKIKTDRKLWLDCMKGKKEALKALQVYCDRDVELLEEVYLRLRPYMKGHPNVNLYNENNEIKCASCASTDLIEDGVYSTSTTIYQAYRCNSCGSISRSRTSKLSANDKKHIIVSSSK